MIIESVKEGFRLTNKNWQLVLLRIAVMIINLLGFLFFIGVPVFIAVISLGVDIANVKDILPGIIDNPAEVLSKYIGMVILMIVTFIIYFTFVSVLALYVFGGTLGVLKNAAFDEQYKFSLSSFFKEAKKIFFPLLWLFSIAFLVITSFVIMFVILAGLLVYVTHLFGESNTTLSVFVTSFFTLLFIFLSIIGGLASVIFTVYAAIALAVENKGVIDSFKITWNFVTTKPISFLFYIILVFGIVGINIVLMILGVSFRMIPVVGVLIDIPYQFIYYGAQTYLGVVMWGSLVVFYIRGTHHPAYTATYDI